MYRLQLRYDLFPEEQHSYGVREITEDVFVSLATGVPVPADIEHEQIYRNRPGDASYVAVWDPENNCWVNNLSEEQARAAYKPWWRQDYP